MRNVYKMKPSGIRCLLSSVLAVVSMAITGTNVAEAQGLSVSGRVTDAPETLNSDPYGAWGGGKFRVLRSS